MDTVFVIPEILRLFLITFFISSFMAGLILSRYISNAGCGSVFCLVSFLIGIFIHVGSVYVSIRYVNAFGQYVFLIQLLSLGIITALGSAVYKTIIRFP